MARRRHLLQRGELEKFPIDQLAAALEGGEGASSRGWAALAGVGRQEEEQFRLEGADPGGVPVMAGTEPDQRVEGAPDFGQRRVLYQRPRGELALPEEPPCAVPSEVDEVFSEAMVGRGFDPMRNARPVGEDGAGLELVAMACEEEVSLTGGDEFE